MGPNIQIIELSNVIRTNLFVLMVSLWLSLDTLSARSVYIGRLRPRRQVEISGLE